MQTNTKPARRLITGDRVKFYDLTTRTTITHTVLSVKTTGKGAAETTFVKTNLCENIAYPSWVNTEFSR